MSKAARILVGLLVAGTISGSVYSEGAPAEEDVRTVVVEETPYRAVLEEGVFVQLLGVRTWNTEGRRTRSWWAPDGGRTPVLLLDRAWSPPHANRDWYDVAIALSSPELDVAFEASGVPYLVGGRAPDSSGEDIEWDRPLLKFSVSGIDPEVSEADFAIGVETGAWTEAGRWDWPWEENPEGLPDHVNVSPPETIHSGDMVRVAVRHSYTDKAARIVLIDRDGSVHTREVPDRIGRASYSFSGLTLDEIESVVLQTRPYRWVEFENVSLRAGQTTDVEVNVRPD